MAKKYEIGYADLSPIAGSEQGGLRLIVIVSPDNQNYTAMVAPMTNSDFETKSTTHVKIDGFKYELLPKKNYTIMLEHMRIIEQDCLIRCIGKLDEADADKLDNALSVIAKLNETDGLS